ncbi:MULTISPECIES: hypothetical protein [unclassified Streptomyces]|uniref:hypothetical protein n=1 Tax=unclassified Streptomyces TaxID=2593676 RepID=UPI0022545BA3|nr:MULTISPECIES: hypothetical protein [unclassified Streptomyces]MCX5555272.1 hypothetical protein [Streptomyces sp. NBC_00038]WRZ24827.1 hypothetical protein OHT59_43060 [Streptomyces sp. NBC_00243]
MAQYFDVPTIPTGSAMQLVSAVIEDGRQHGRSFAATVVDNRASGWMPQESAVFDWWQPAGYPAGCRFT